MLGIGNATQNLSLRLSEYGGARLEGSASIVNGIQINGNYNAATGGFGIGANINAGDGPRSGANLNINYDTIERFSGGISYTDSTTGFGMSYRVDREGNVTISSLLNGVVMGTVTGNGYSNMDMDWVQHNINAAQDRGRLLGQVAKLREAGLTDEQIQGLSEEDKSKLERKIDEDKILKEKANLTAEQIKDLSPDKRAELLKQHMPAPVSVNLENIALGALGALGGFSLALLSLVYRVGTLPINLGVSGVQSLINLFTGPTSQVLDTQEAEALRKEAEDIASILKDPAKVKEYEERYGKEEFAKKVEAFKQSLMSEAAYIIFPTGVAWDLWDSSANTMGIRASLGALGITKVDAFALEELGLKPEDFHTESGMHAELFYDSNTKKYVLAFRGTEPTSFMDILADVINLPGFTSSQHRDAMKLAEKLMNTPEFENRISFTGHSLGGGLASAAAGSTGLTANTYNAANIGWQTRLAMGDGANGLDQRVNYYQMPGEFASLFQDPFLMPATGQRTQIDGEYDRSWYNPRSMGELHSIHLFTRALYNDIVNGTPQTAVTNSN
ncbi:hypothetical protein [Leptospira idonii]|uniref:DUF2974 domain-containing protein n=1 Tax=Leptospira idonii TaxID=1193500 RepID=A0A4R9M6F8_9LEPT|nr:hypothetical protein [Leptospira idonii]TGN20268.1 hypothetical protein EHS15_04600 [Leptospira idonii]